MWEYNYICHHGIKGQKWGIRRYQNEDGTLTPAGRQRALEDKYNLERKASKKNAKAGRKVVGSAVNAAGAIGITNTISSNKALRKAGWTVANILGYNAGLIAKGKIAMDASAYIAALGPYAAVALGGLAVVGIGAAAANRIIAKKSSQEAKSIDAGLDAYDRTQKIKR